MTKEQIAEKIKKMRREKGYSVNKLAKLANVAYSTCNRMEKTKADLNVQTLQKICNALGIGMSEFFNEQKDSVQEKMYIVAYMAPNERICVTLGGQNNLKPYIKRLKEAGHSVIAISEITDDELWEIIEE